MHTELNSELKLFLAFIFSSFAYGFLIAQNGLILNNLTSIAFIGLNLFYFYMFFNLVKKNQNEKHTLIKILAISFCINFFLILGTAAANPSQSILWVVDSYDVHIPGSVRLMNAITSDQKIVRTSIYDRTYMAHISGAIFFIIFGVNHIASALSLIIPKVICSFFIFKSTKEFFDKEKAIIASLSYAILPTVLFYTTTFYKEATLQMLVSAIIYFIVKSYKQIKVKYVVTLLLLFALLGNERHYLLPCFATAVILFALLNKKIHLVLKAGILTSCFAGYFIFTSYYWDISVPTLVVSLNRYRDMYTNYSDVSAYNLTLPYPLLVMKLLFSPFITPVKLQTYSHYATLLTWGSAVYHLVILSFLYGFYQIIKQKIEVRLLLVLTAPLFFFLLFFGYVAPYNGRLRDSFLPLIVMIASLGIAKIINRIIKWKASEVR